MATTSVIARIGTNSVTYIHCQCDGYLDYQGRVLFDHYKSTELVDQLLAQGNLVLLGYSPETSRRTGTAASELTSTSALHAWVKSNVDYAYAYKDSTWWACAAVTGWKFVLLEDAFEIVSAVHAE